MKPVSHDIDFGIWRVKVLLDVTSLDADEAIDELIRCGCRGNRLRKAKDALWHGIENSQLIYNDRHTRCTLLIIGKGRGC